MKEQPENSYIICVYVMVDVLLCYYSESENVNFCELLTMWDYYQ